MPDVIVFYAAWMAKYDADRTCLGAGGVTSVSNMETSE
jgi:hypothetical protein